MTVLLAALFAVALSFFFGLLLVRTGGMWVGAGPLLIDRINPWIAVAISPAPIALVLVMVSIWL